MTKQFKIGGVYSLELSHKSFSWNNGLFICLKFDKTTLWGCKLDAKGKPQKFDDGKRYMSFCTGVNNPEIKPTNLTFKLEKDFTHN